MQEYTELPEECLLTNIDQKDLTGHLNITYNKTEQKVRIIIKDKEGKLKLRDLYLQLDMIASYYEIDYNPKEVNFEFKEEKSYTIIIAAYFNTTAK